MLARATKCSQLWLRRGLKGFKELRNALVEWCFGLLLCASLHSVLRDVNHMFCAGESQRITRRSTAGRGAYVSRFNVEVHAEVKAFGYESIVPERAAKLMLSHGLSKRVAPGLLHDMVTNSILGCCSGIVTCNISRAQFLQHDGT